MTVNQGGFRATCLATPLLDNINCKGSVTRRIGSCKFKFVNEFIAISITGFYFRQQCLQFVSQQFKPWYKVLHAIMNHKASLAMAL